ncbi:hypothetical protein [uncultured Shewanella sp.]|uniref:hypothetical protein n=1 Tax=uncultured Shewanella sp. TaxID=173975 RepID=UPI00260E4AF8|nr:hypothetical protein [uncultured Shewanella sp.]
MNQYFKATIDTSVDQLLGIVPIAVIVFCVLKYPVLSEIAAEVTKVKRLVLVRFFVGTMVIVMLSTLWSYVEHLQWQHRIENNLFLQTKGCITDYQVVGPKPETRLVAFRVNGVDFQFSSIDSGPFFKGGGEQDNVISNGLCVAIDYLSDGSRHRILKILLL